AYGVGHRWNPSDDGNSIVYNGVDPRYTDFLDFSKSIYDCGGLGVYEEYWQEDRNKQIATGDAVFVTSPAELVETDFVPALEAVDLDWHDTLGFMPYVTGPNGNKATDTSMGKAGSFIFIPAYMEEQAVETIKFVDKLFEDDFIMDTYYGVEGETFEYAEDGTPYLIVDSNELPYGSPGAYMMASYDIKDAKSFPYKYQYFADKYEAGEDIGANMTAMVEMNTEDARDVTNQNIGDKAILLQETGNQSQCMEQKIVEFTDFYVTGRETDFSALEEYINNTCNFQAVNEEMNDWYTNVYLKS
ncbi:MAG: hypothetical protein ACK5G7_02765, partial [Erysipelotrichaceae bacterium]